ncbi:hypothetical protein AB2M62_15745 [Sphingomonas sp. MMS12-HWE2-04]|uniref:hypothetical protein n=1 Tax=Sphingomonas sp. MMS12-HWE2-04 TaxID=3234199 RepID=UPI00384AA31D
MFLPLLFQVSPAVDAALTEYRAKTAVEVRCASATDADELVVCARRQAYRHQLPLVPRYNRANDGHDQEARIMTPEAQGLVECGQGAFIVHCGSVGVGVTVGSSGEVRRAPPP